MLTKYREWLREDVLIQQAAQVSRLGTCNRLRVGAVIARGQRVLSSGYNGAPAHMPHCDHGPDESGCRATVHAEANAIVWAARQGVQTDGSILYVTHTPCLECAKLIINAGIWRVVFLDDYRLTEGKELLNAAGIVVHQHQGPPVQ